MPNIDISRLKREVESMVSIMDVIEDYGYPTQRVGKDVRIRCPFHVGDKNASMSIQPTTQMYHCFSCGEKGKGSVEFVQAHEALRNPDFTLTDAILYLVDRFELDISLNNIDAIREQEIKERYTVDGVSYSKDKIDVTKYNRKLVDLFKIYLLNNKGNSKVQSQIHYDYLMSRGLTLEAIHNFEIGFCPMGALERLYNKTTDIKFKQYLLSSGMLNIGYNKQVNEFYKDRVMFPIKDTKGHILGFTGRTLDPRDAAKYKLSKETKYFTKSDLLYGYDVAKDSIKKEGKVILLEGNMDVVSSHQLGLTNAVGLNGCSISEKQIKIIKNTGANVVLALDNDNAGHNGTIKIAEQLKAEGINVSAIDIGDFGNFKDNGDILEASLKNKEITNNFVQKYTSLEENIFEFKLKHGLFANKPINYNTITQTFNEIKETLSPGEKVLFKRFVTQNSEFTKEDITDILSSQEEKKGNLYAEIGMMIINPYLNEKNLSDSQKNLVISKIIMNPDRVLFANDATISMNKDAIDLMIDEILDNSAQKVKTQALKNEINCREKVSENKNKIFTIEGYQELHKELYKNDKDAGVLRTRTMYGSNFTKSYEIEDKFKAICSEIQNYPKNSEFNNKLSFLAHISNEILCLNAFETTAVGKIERIFIESTARELGVDINYRDNKDLYVSGYKSAVGEIMKHNDGTPAFYNLFQKICEPVLENTKTFDSDTINRNDRDIENGFGPTKNQSSFQNNNSHNNQQNRQNYQNNYKNTQNFQNFQNTQNIRTNQGIQESQDYAEHLARAFGINSNDNSTKDNQQSEEEQNYESFDAFDNERLPF